MTEGWLNTVMLTILVLAGCETAQLPAPGGNNVCDSPAVRAELPGVLGETSGVAASRVHEGIYWGHNDSGGDPAVYAFDSTATIRATVRIPEATNRDWEDIAIGPCEPGSERDCLFIAETGDNSEHHPHVAIYRAPEPDPATDSISAPATIFRFRYPGGARDAEGVFITEAGIHIVNKGRTDAIELFRLPPPYNASRIVEAVAVQRLAPPPTSHSALVTAAAAHPDGQNVVIRTYAGLHFFRMEADTLRVHGRAADIVAPRQMQGEAVDFLPDGRFILTGEGQGQNPQTLVIVACDPLRPPPDTTDSQPPEPETRP